MSAVQLPRDIRGEALCRHARPGSCTWWCSYRRAVCSIGSVAGLVLAGWASMWMWGDAQARERAAEAVGAVGLVVAVGVVAVLLTDRVSNRL
ncbi:hypothetical protein [Saccharothrix lopnurensis]|uniref:Uncharacterized protein n=1 Tax=Saccharothrix lopnurensis TaxID=1670621 RepID=A0ABW1PGR5_9PSEU